jgi:hypothetical protein
MEHRLSVASASEVCSSITTGGSHEFLDHSGIDADTLSMLKRIAQESADACLGTLASMFSTLK